MVRLARRGSGQWMLEVSAPVPQPGQPLYGKWVPYIARIRGLDVTYGFKREFLGVRNQVEETQYCVLAVERLAAEIIETRSVHGTRYWEFVPGAAVPDVMLQERTRRHAQLWAQWVQQQEEGAPPTGKPPVPPRPQTPPAPQAPVARRIDLHRIE
jgi:hypothetical protein